MLDGACDAGLDLLQPEGLQDVVEGAELDEAVGVRAVPDAGDDDDGRLRLPLPDDAEQFHAAQAGNGVSVSTPS